MGAPITVRIEGLAGPAPGDVTIEILHERKCNALALALPGCETVGKASAASRGEIGQARLDYRVLGPLEVVLDDGVPALVPRRERALVAVLLVLAWSPVSRDTLARALWGDSPPADPEAALRVCMCRARHALGAAGRCLTAREGAYRADPRPQDLDLGRFRQLRAAADGFFRRGQLRPASTALEQALACWRQPALADLPDAPELAAQRARLLEERRLTELALTDVLLQLGEHLRIVADLHARVVADPSCERSWAQLMLALYQCGRRGEALAVYTKATAALRPPNGGGPGDELQAVLNGVLNDQRGVIAIPAQRSAPAVAPAPV